MVAFAKSKYTLIPRWHWLLYEAKIWDVTQSVHSSIHLITHVQKYSGSMWWHIQSIAWYHSYSRRCTVLYLFLHHCPAWPYTHVGTACLPLTTRNQSTHISIFVKSHLRIPYVDANYSSEVVSYFKLFVEIPLHNYGHWTSFFFTVIEYLCSLA